MNRISGWTAALSLSALFVGMMSATPANAQYGSRDSDRGRSEIRRDIEDIRRDERRLHDLEDLRDRQRRHRDWDAARDTQRRIDDLRRHIERDRRELRRDIDDTRRDRDTRSRDDYRNRDRYDTGYRRY